MELAAKQKEGNTKQPLCPKCGAKIIETYPNPDDPQEQIYVCHNGHHNHYVTFQDVTKEPLYKVDQINNKNPEPEWKPRYSRKAAEQTAQLLSEIQKDPGHCKSHYCRAMNGKPERYCYDKNCYANRWKGARMKLYISDCEHRKPTVWRRFNVLQAAGLIRIVREKVKDKWMQRGWDWMKVCYPINL